jgi:homoserine kinase type II
LRELRSPIYDQLHRLAIHGDFHPGNLTFQQDHVSGLFDFDWARMDVRCFDVALSIFYFCVQWQDGVDGQLDADRAVLFLQTYQNMFRGKPVIGAVNNDEKGILSDMVLAADIYVLGWILSDFYTGHVDVDQYAGYLRHGLNYMRWAEENNRQRLLWCDIIENGE